MADTTLRGLWLRVRAALYELPEGEAERDARLIVQAALRLTPVQFVAEMGQAVRAPQGAIDHLWWMTAERAKRRPLSHILGLCSFWGRDFEVTSDTLAPRGDTETLIALALERPFERMLDLGTGTGCIAVTLLAERAEATGIASDISPEALQVAARNGARHGVEGRLAYLKSDWDAALGPEQFDLIVSNPPYIPEADWAQLAPEVRIFEPKGALTPGADGLAPYRVLAALAKRRLKAGGRILVEIGYDQGTEVAAIFRGADLRDVIVHQDFSGKDRVVDGSNALHFLP